MKRFKLYFLLLLAVMQVGAQEKLDSIEVSLITCSPGHEVYSLYGHTAIRCQDFTRGADFVFNYGVFSFSQPHFMWRFVLGKCDYMVDAMPWAYFLPEYEKRGSRVTAQVLNLSQEEANRLFRTLIENCRKENCEYRYNFLYNNCTTKARDIIERSVDGEVEYAPMMNKRTYREILHEYAGSNTWESEGNDMLLGWAVDTILDDRSQMFAPEYMLQYAQDACIRNLRGDAKPLVKRTDILVEKRPVSVPPFLPVSPLVAGLLLLAFALLIVGIEYACHYMLWFWDVILLLLQGLTGCLLTFMLLFSEHPAVNTNWLIWLFCPIALISLPGVVSAAWKRKKTLWHAVNFTILTSFMVFSPWIPQDFGDIIVPLALVLLSRPISYYLFYQHKKEK